MAVSPQITDAYRRRLVALGDRTEVAAKQAWPSIEEFDETRWVERMTVQVSRAQTQGVRLASGYLSAFLRSEGAASSRQPLDVAKYAGVSRDGRPLAEALESPLIGVRAALGDGKSVPASLAFGLQRGTRLTKFEVVQASRDALVDLIEAHPNTEGFSRAVAGTCAACMAISGASGPRFEVHPECQCIPAPQTVPRSPAQVLAGREYVRPEGYPSSATFALDRYFGNINSFQINSGLRGLTPFGGRLEQLAEGLDAAMTNAGAIGAPVRVYRAVVGSIDELIGGAGTTGTELGFSSTTASREWIDEFLEQRPAHLGDGDSIVMDLDVDPRVKAVWGANPAESELLLERGCRYVIEGVKKEGNTWRVKATVLPPA